MIGNELIKENIINKIELFSSEFSRDECESVVRSLESLQWNESLDKEVVVSLKRYM